MRCGLRVTRQAVAFLAVLTLLIVWGKPLTAQPQSQNNQQEVRQLRDRLQQMDLMMDGLKAEINTLERQGQQPSTGTKKAPEQPLGVVAIPSEAVIAQPLPGTVPIEGEITEGKNEVSIYGFAMLDSGIWVVGDGLKEFANVCWKRNCQHLNGHGQSSQSDPEESTAR